MIQLCSINLFLGLGNIVEICYSVGMTELRGALRSANGSLYACFLRGYRRLMEHYTAVGDIKFRHRRGSGPPLYQPLQELVQERVIEFM